MNPEHLLSEKLNTLHEGLMALYHASAELQFSKPLSSLLKGILRGIKAGTGVNKAAVFVKNESSKTFLGSATLGLNEDRISQAEIDLTDEEEACLLRTTFFSPSDDLSVPPHLVALFQRDWGLKDADVIPLEIRDRLVGLLVCERVPLHLREILIIFSRQMAVAIENAHLFTQVEEMALKDPLTNLYNRRYFLQILDYEIGRAKRYRQPLSLIFIDLDHFKTVNDTFGHSTGDQLLRQISQKLNGLFRTTDLLARYAGDEFVAVLPATAQEGALILANRIKEALNCYKMMVRGQTVQVSVSIGVDTLENAEGIGSATFLDRADKAMYEAKASGRNLVKSFNQLTA